MKLDHGFLDKPIDKWESDPGYILAKDKIKSLSVVNVGAERGVKLTHTVTFCRKTSKMSSNLSKTIDFLCQIRGKGI